MRFQFLCTLRFSNPHPLSEIKIGFDRVGSRGKDHVSIIGGKYICAEFFLLLVINPIVAVAIRFNARFPIARLVSLSADR